MAKKTYSKSELWAFIFGEQQPEFASKLTVRKFSNQLIDEVTGTLVKKQVVEKKQVVSTSASTSAVAEPPKKSPAPKKKTKKQLRREQRLKKKSKGTVKSAPIEITPIESVEEVIKDQVNIPVEPQEAELKMDDQTWGDWDLSTEEETAVEELIESSLEEDPKPQAESIAEPKKEEVKEEPTVDPYADDVGIQSLKESIKISDAEKSEALKKGLSKTKRGFFERIGRAIAGKTKINDADLDDIEEALISSDVSLDTTVKIIERLEERVAKDKFLNVSELYRILKEEIVGLLSENNVIDLDDFVIPGKQRPYVIMVVGVNGVGKTTTIGKLAHHFTQRGKKVILGAADTFRAAAVDQLTIWAERTGVEIVSKGMNADPSSVAFDTMVSAKSKNADLVLIDTAGRLHNKKGLMEELAKIKRVMSKHIPDAPHEVMLILDGSTGQNALEQAKQFSQFTQISSLSVTKLDGTAKGGVVIAIADQLKIPIRYIGVGEKANQLQVFNKKNFVDSLFD